MCYNCSNLISAIDRYIAKADDDLKDALKNEGYADPEMTVEYIEKIEDGVTDALKAETKILNKAIKRSIDLNVFARVWGEMAQEDTLAEDIAGVVTDNLRKFVPVCVGYYLKRTDRELVLHRLSKRAEAWISNWSTDLGKLMKLNSHEEIQRIYDKGLKEGIGIEELGRRILNNGIRDERYKARRCAITEVLTAHRAAQQEAYMQSPAVEEKMWRHTGNYRNKPRPNHEDIDGQIKPVNEPFDLVGADGVDYQPMYPGDTSLPAGERINCHCIIQPVVSDEILGMSLKERKALQQQALDEMDDEWEKSVDNSGISGIMKLGINLFDKSDPIFFDAFSIEEEPNFEDVYLHGSSSSVQIIRDGKPINLNPIEFIDVLKQKGYSGGNIRLASCSTGAGDNSFAQQLSKELRITVKAPDSDVYFIPDDGVLFVGSPYGNTGKWRVFKNGVEIND